MKDLSKVAGGIARAQKLTPEERSEIAIKASQKAWDTSIPYATHEGILRIGDKTINCVVTETGDRILSIKNFFETFGRTSRGYKRINREIIRPPFMDALNLEPFISAQLEELVKPVEYRGLNGKIAKGYKADLLPQVCLTYLKADTAGKTTPSQKRIVETSVVIIGALSTVGIIALVDEATGYQRDRATDALSKLLQAYIAKELQPWVATVPADFYKELFRLRGLNYLESSVKRPIYFGTLTNNILYARLAPGILEELKRICPRNEKGQLKHKYFQKLTENHGTIKLRERLASVVSIMKLSENYKDFMEKINKIHPILSLDEFNEDEDTGVGI